MTPKTSRRHPDPAEIDDITDKGWRIMSLTVCFAIVSALVLLTQPDEADSAELTLCALDW